MAQRFWEKVETAGACWLWQGSLAGSLGYGQFRNESGNTEYAHRVSYRLAHGSIPPGMLVLHRCDVPKCVRPEHLYLGTSADNSADMVESLRVRRGHRKRIGGMIFSVRISDDLLAKVDAIAKQEKLSRSDVIRVSLENFYARLFNKAA